MITFDPRPCGQLHARIASELEYLLQKGIELGTPAFVPELRETTEGWAGGTAVATQPRDGTILSLCDQQHPNPNTTSGAIRCHGVLGERVPRILVLSFRENEDGEFFPTMQRVVPSPQEKVSTSRATTNRDSSSSLEADGSDGCRCPDLADSPTDKTVGSRLTA